LRGFFHNLFAILFNKWEKIRVINLFTAYDKEDENMEAEIIEKTKQYFKRKKSVNQK